MEQIKTILPNLYSRLENNENIFVAILTPFYGGQGTINVPSWNPEGTQFAYVVYSLEDL